MEEQWENIHGFANYQVSSYGQVRNKKTGRLLSLHCDRGYLNVKLFDNGKRSSFKVHRIVAKAFLENYSEELQIDHIDRMRSNNHVTNLRCVNNRDNVINSIAYGTIGIIEQLRYLQKEEGCQTIEDVIKYFEKYR